MGLSKQPDQNTTEHLTVSFKNSKGTLTADFSDSSVELSATLDGSTLYDSSMSFGSVKIEVGTTELRLADNIKAAGTYSPEICKSARVHLTQEVKLQVPKDYEEVGSKRCAELFCRCMPKASAAGLCLVQWLEGTTSHCSRM